MHYTLLDDTTVLWQDDKLASGILQPADEGWQAYLDWLGEGNTPAPAMADPQLTHAQAMTMVSLAFEQACTPLRETYPPAEVESWPTQATEAAAWLANDAAPTPLIDAVLWPWEDKAAFCAALCEQHHRYAAAMGERIAWRRMAEAAVDAFFAQGPRSTFCCQYPDVPSAT